MALVAPHALADADPVADLRLHLAGGYCLACMGFMEPHAARRDGGYCTGVAIEFDADRAGGATGQHPAGTADLWFVCIGPAASIIGL